MRVTISMDKPTELGAKIVHLNKDETIEEEDGEKFFQPKAWKQDNKRQLYHAAHVSNCFEDSPTLENRIFTKTK